MRKYFLILCLLISAAGCTGKPSGGPPAPAQKAFPPVPVVSGKVLQKTIPVKLQAIGNVQAYSTVSVKAQIGGTVTHVHFREGQYVQQNELLFDIDARPYQVQLKQMEANLARDKAQAENARQQVLRYQQLVKSGYVAQADYDQVLATSQALEGTLLADEAAIENAKLQIEFCAIRSPIDGVTGSILLHEGNVVKANDINLVVINQVKPILISFTVPGQYLSDIKARMAMEKLKIEAASPGKENSPITGELNFIDNNVDLQTGTIQLKGVFKNQDKSLWPGQFVNVTLFLSRQDNALVVPTQAVQTGQAGQYVYVIKADLTVELRAVTVAKIVDDETVIAKGLNAGEEVVVDGQLRLVPGAKVQPRK